MPSLCRASESVAKKYIFIVFKLGSKYRNSLCRKKSKEINLHLSTLTDTNQQFHCQSPLLTVHLVRTQMTLSPLPRVFVGYVALIPTNTCWVRVCIDFQNYRVKYWITVLHSGLPWKGVNPEGTQRSCSNFSQHLGLEWCIHHVCFEGKLFLYFGTPSVFWRTFWKNCLTELRNNKYVADNIFNLDIKGKD